MDLAPFLPLVGIPLVVAGFALRFNALLVVLVAGTVTGLCAGLEPLALLELFGAKFMASRSLAVVVLLLPVVALVECHGLREHAQTWVGRLRGASTGRLLMLYYLLRQGTAALGLTSLGGPAQTVRPLLAPMAGGLAVQRHGPLPPALRERILAHAAACDNVALFFGEDIFIAFGAVLLIHSFMQQSGIPVAEPLVIGLWAIPTALCAAVVHLARLSRLDAQIAAALPAEPSTWEAA